MLLQYARRNKKLRCCNAFTFTKRKNVWTENPSEREYFKFFGLDETKLSLANSNAVIMHPGPMNEALKLLQHWQMMLIEALLKLRLKWELQSECLLLKH